MQHHLSAISKQARPALRPYPLFDRPTAKCLLETCPWLANAECSQRAPVLLYTARPFLSVHSEHASCCMQVYKGTWLGQVVAIKVLDGAAAASQKARKEVRQCMPVHGVIWVCCMSIGQLFKSTFMIGHMHSSIEGQCWSALPEPTLKALKFARSTNL